MALGNTHGAISFRLDCRSLIDNEERAGRKRWYHGLVRSAPLIQAGLFALLLVTALLSVWRDL